MSNRKLLNVELGRVSKEEYKQLPESGIVVVLDNIRSAHNVGSAFRTADSFKADKVWLCGICAVPPSAEIHKSALGAEDSVLWEHVDDTMDAVRRLKEDGYTMVLPPFNVTCVLSASTICVLSPGFVLTSCQTWASVLPMISQAIIKPRGIAKAAHMNPAR